MNQQTRLILIILALLAVFGVGSTFFFYQANQKALAAGRQLQQQVLQRSAAIESLQGENRQLHDSEKRLIDERQTLEERSTIALRDLEQVKRELAQTKEELAGVNTQMAALQSERDALSSELSKLRAAKGEMDRTLAALRADKGAADKALADVQAQLAHLEAEHKQLKGRSVAQPPVTPEATVGAEGGLAAMPPTAGGAVTLPPIIVQHHRPVFHPVAVTGKIVTVNPDHQFIIVNKGSADGVRVGDRFLVSRGQKTLGAVTVIRLRATIAACDMRSLGPTARPRVGDTVALQQAAGQ